MLSIIRTGFGLAALAALALAGCGGGGGGGPVTAPLTLVSIQVTPAVRSIGVGATQQFVATGIYSDNTQQDLSSTAAWSSSDSFVATVDAVGLATGIASDPTAVTITAMHSGISGTASLTVTAALVSIQVTPASSTIATDATQQFVATGIYSDNFQQDLSSTAAWSSSNSLVATVDAVGLATGIAANPTAVTITATHSGISGTAQLTVTAAATLVSIQVTPADSSIVLGTTQQFVATGSYSNATTQNLSATATWNSNALGIATISTAGLATSQAEGGPVSITATHSGVSGTTNLTVTAAGAAEGSAATPITVTGAPRTCQVDTAIDSYYSYTAPLAGWYKVAITNLTDDVDLHVYTDKAYITAATCNPDNTFNAGTAAEDCSVSATSGQILYIGVQNYAAGDLAANGAGFTLSVSTTTAPVAPQLVNEGAPNAPLAIKLPYNGQVAKQGVSYYAYTTAAASTSLITVMNMSSDVDPRVFTSPTFATLDTNWACSGWSGTINDTCTATAAVPAGAVLYIEVTDWSDSGASFTLQ